MAPRERDDRGRFVSRESEDDTDAHEEETEVHDHEAQGPDADAEADGREVEASGNGAGRDPDDISDTTAPSVGPHTTFHHEDPEERLARHEQSDVDAMGLDKRRGVVGQSYGPSFAKQARLYGSVLLVAIAVVVGFVLLAGKLDQPPDTIQAKAPWTGTKADTHWTGLNPEPKRVN